MVELQKINYQEKIAEIWKKPIRHDNIDFH